MCNANIFRLFGLDPDKRYSCEEISNLKNKKISYLSQFSGLEYDTKRIEISKIDEKQYTSEVQNFLAEEEKKRLLELEKEFSSNLYRQLKLLEHNITDTTFLRIAEAAYKWPISADIEMPIFVKYILQNKSTVAEDLELFARKHIINKIKEFIQNNGIVITGDPSNKQVCPSEKFSISALTSRKNLLNAVGKRDFYDFLGINVLPFTELRLAIDKELQLVRTPKYTKDAEATQRRTVLLSIDNAIKTEQDKIFYDKEIEYAKLLPLLTFLDNACRTSKVISNKQFNTLVEEGLCEGVDKLIVEEFIYAVANERKYFVDSSEKLSLMCTVCGMPCLPPSSQNPKCVFCKNEFSPVSLCRYSLLQRLHFLKNYDHINFFKFIKKNSFLLLIFAIIVAIVIFFLVITRNVKDPVPIPASNAKVTPPSQTKAIPNDTKVVLENKVPRTADLDASSQRFIKLDSDVILDKKCNLEWIVHPNKGISWFVLEVWISSLKGSHGLGWEIPSLTQLETLMNSGSFEAQCKQHSNNLGQSNTQKSQTVTIHLNDIFSKECWNVWSADEKDSNNQYYFMFSNGKRSAIPVMDCGEDCPQAFAVRRHGPK